MTATHMLRLLLLAAIWGGSFLFMRVCAPVLGAAVLVESRVLLAALFLALVGLVLKKRLEWSAHWKHYFILAFFNSAFPFLLYAYAARTLSASVLSVLNATSPMWGALIASIWTRHAIAPRVLVGLVLGTAGVALLVGLDDVSSRPGAALAIGATMIGAISYSVASAYARSAKSVEPFANAHGSMWASAILVLPALALFPVTGEVTTGIVAATVVFGVVCTGVAYILYFGLIRDIGPTSALTVTFLNPLFGILWGALFLGEVIGWHTVLGAAVVIVGTALVTGFMPRLRRR